MATIKFVNAKGVVTKVEASVGTSVMLAAVDNHIDGIIGECGGICGCGTCHCYVDENWLDKVGEPDEEELMMLEDVYKCKPNSRLGCQIKMSEELDGLTVYLPALHDDL